MLYQILAVQLDSMHWSGASQVEAAYIFLAARSQRLRWPLKRDNVAMSRSSVEIKPALVREFTNDTARVGFIVPER